jgi:hypothetical protein
MLDLRAEMLVGLGGWVAALCDHNVNIYGQFEIKFTFDIVRAVLMLSG